jgi:transposase InsO family protein
MSPLRVGQKVTVTGMAPAGHPFELYLALNDIEHRRTKAPCPQTNGSVERFHPTAPDEFFRPVFREPFYDTVAALQADPDTWLAALQHRAAAPGLRRHGPPPDRHGQPVPRDW